MTSDLETLANQNSKIRQHTCPWWFLFTFDNPLRRLYQDPVKILAPHISSGDRILDLGCGMGFLTIPAADLAGKHGEVVAVDLQQRMLDGLGRKAHKAGLQDRIQLQIAGQDSISVSGVFDLALAFWMVHEVLDRKSFITQISEHLRRKGKLLIAEPYIHVSRRDFQRTVSIIKETGFSIIDEPEIGFSRALLVVKE